LKGAIVPAPVDLPTGRAPGGRLAEISSGNADQKGGDAVVGGGATGLAPLSSSSGVEMEKRRAVTPEGVENGIHLQRQHQLPYNDSVGLLLDTLPNLRPSMSVMPMNPQDPSGGMIAENGQRDVEGGVGVGVAGAEGVVMYPQTVNPVTGAGSPVMWHYPYAGYPAGYPVPIVAGGDVVGGHEQYVQANGGFTAEIGNGEAVVQKAGSPVLVENGVREAVVVGRVEEKVKRMSTTLPTEQSSEHVHAHSTPDLPDEASSSSPALKSRWEFPFLKKSRDSGISANTGDASTTSTPHSQAQAPPQPWELPGMGIQRRTVHQRVYSNLQDDESREGGQTGGNNILLAGLIGELPDVQSEDPESSHDSPMIGGGDTGLQQLQQLQQMHHQQQMQGMYNPGQVNGWKAYGQPVSMEYQQGQPAHEYYQQQQQEYLQQQQQVIGLGMHQYPADIVHDNEVQQPQPQQPPPQQQQTLPPHGVGHMMMMVDPNTGTPVQVPVPVPLPYSAYNAFYTPALPSPVPPNMAHTGTFNSSSNSSSMDSTLSVGPFSAHAVSVESMEVEVGTEERVGEGEVVVAVGESEVVSGGGEITDEGVVVGKEGGL
ncbi:hypothetical protein HDU76_005121, partial [Blyttiomyces sp. JEL0837]